MQTIVIVALVAILVLGLVIYFAMRPNSDSGSDGAADDDGNDDAPEEDGGAAVEAKDEDDSFGARLEGVIEHTHSLLEAAEGGGGKAGAAAGRGAPMRPGEPTALHARARRHGGVTMPLTASKPLAKRPSSASSRTRSRASNSSSTRPTRAASSPSPSSPSRRRLSSTRRSRWPTRPTATVCVKINQ